MKNEKLVECLYWLMLVIATVATMGSLYFSEILGYAPCTLCWYQRIAMYTLVPVFFVASLRNMWQTIWLVLPQILIGWTIALYHVLLYKGVFEKSEGLCDAGVSCTTTYIEWFGFVTIPLLAFTAFTLIAICAGVLIKVLRK